jgi:hypothetical protein
MRSLLALRVPKKASDFDHENHESNPGERFESEP